ncbi:MAG: hypothetical protein WA705_01115 [Candidatus Ozemobacteraceae bacterium]
MNGPEFSLAAMYRLFSPEKGSRINNRPGMAIPMVLGLIVVAGILGSTLWMSGRVGATRANRSIDMLQLTHVAEAGITEGFLRLKKDILQKKPFEQIRISDISREIPLERRTGMCEGKVVPLGSGRFRMTSKGWFQFPTGKPTSAGIMNLSAVAEVKVTTVRDPSDSSRWIKHYRCTLSEFKREEADFGQE